MIDISVEVEDEDMIKKYNLGLGQACLANEQQMPIYDEMWNMKGRTAVPGGSAMNSARAANYFNRHKYAKFGSVTYFGAIGKDERGEVIKKDLTDVGINA